MNDKFAVADAMYWRKLSCSRKSTAAVIHRKGVMKLLWRLRAFYHHLCLSCYLAHIMQDRDCQVGDLHRCKEGDHWPYTLDDLHRKQADWHKRWGDSQEGRKEP